MGAVGPTGSQGPKGDKGDAGKDGADGKDGVTPGMSAYATIAYVDAQIAALDGELAGDAATYAGAEGTGVISSGVFDAIDAAIRAQNGEETWYTPAEMAPAILALSWDKGYKLRALLLDDGTLELNYLDGRQTTQAGRTWTKVYYIDPAGYASNGAVLWVNEKLDITRVVIDGSVARQGISDASYWFVGCLNLTEVWGFENLNGITKATQMFNSCSSLESIYCPGTFNQSKVSGSLMFANCTRMVGYNGFVPSMTTEASAAKLGQGGALTDPDADVRTWCRVRLYASGTVYVSAMDDAGRASEAVLADGRMCANANLNYWFYGYSAPVGVSGWGNVAVVAMRYTFTACTAMSTLSLEGLDCAGITDLFYTFSGCNALTTIYVGADFVGPGLTSSGCFYNCAKLVGGNGTAYSSNAHSAAYFRVDAVGTPGYLTAG